MRVSNSKIKTFRRCPNKYRYKYIEKIQPRKKAIQLERGSWIHELLQYHYDGEDWRERHKQLSAEFYTLFDEEREHLGELPVECKRIMLSYLRHYKQEDQRYRVIDSELNEFVDLPNGLKLNVVVDLIVEEIDTGGLWLWDHKTRDKMGAADDMILDPQLTLYFYALEKMGYTPLHGAVYNELRTKAPTVPALLARGGLSKAKNIDTDVFTYMRAIKKHELDPSDYSDILRHIALRQTDRFFRRTPMPKDKPVVKTMMRELIQTASDIQRAERKEHFQRTFDMSCRWQCEYKDLCITELFGGDIEHMVKANFDQRVKD